MRINLRLFILLPALMALTVFLVTPNQVVDAKNTYWADEFNGAAGTAPDPNKWVHDVGTLYGTGWGNNELQCYTNSTGNSYHDGAGKLVIEARKQPGYVCSDGYIRDYTSARLTTKGKMSKQYGKIEMRAKIPGSASGTYSKGIWPAFWTLGTTYPSPEQWPQSGEIDIMENIGTEPRHISGNVHGQGNDGQHYHNPVHYYASQDMYADYHIYSIVWAENSEKFYFDGVLYGTRTASDLPAGAWDVNKAMFLLMNVAVGGNWPGSPDANTIFPQKMYVDYVRVYP